MSLPPDRLLVIDASLDTRLAQQLEQRGRAARSAEWLGLADELDQPLLRALASKPEDLVLVTGDDDMPGEHGDLIAKLGITIATVDGRVDRSWGRAEWKRETIHRWAHVIHLQQEGTLERYSPSAHRPWTSRRRPRPKRR